MTVEQFYADYCARSGIDPLRLAERRRAYTCTCGEDTCQGFAMLNWRDIEEDRQHGWPTPGISSDDPGYAPRDDA